MSNLIDNIYYVETNKDDILISCRMITQPLDDYYLINKYGLRNVSMSYKNIYEYYIDLNYVNTVVQIVPRVFYNILKNMVINYLREEKLKKLL
jgi:hypothetical protein